MDIVLVLIAVGLFWGMPALLIFRANRAPRPETTRWAVGSAGIGVTLMVLAVLVGQLPALTVTELIVPFLHGASYIAPWLAYVLFLRLHGPKRINDPRIRTMEYVAEHRGANPTYALSVSLSTQGAADLIEQMKLVGIEFLHWKNARGSACEKVMFAILAEPSSHAELKQAIASARATETWPGPFMRSLNVTVALLDRHGTPTEEYGLVGA